VKLVIIKTQAHGVTVPRNWWVRVDLTRNPLSIARTNLNTQSRRIEFGDLTNNQESSNNLEWN